VLAVPHWRGKADAVAQFVPGLELVRSYWQEVVRPVIDFKLPAERRAAALIGDGSDVLGFDTAQSTDHGWGPRLFVFADVTPDEARQLDDLVDKSLPATFRGWPTRFPARDGARVRHQVRIMGLRAFFERYLGWDATRPPVDADWLATPTQLLGALTAGAVFEDGPGTLTAARRRLVWYPDHVWLYLLGCQWRRVDQEEAFVGRAGQVGDELGSAVICARLVRDLVRLCFLLERRYTPYTKWMGTAFERLDCSPSLTPLLRQTLAAHSWQERARWLVAAAEEVAARFNRLGLIAPLDTTARPFFDRPFRVLGSGRFAEACLAGTPFGRLGPVGAVDQFVDSTDVLSNPLVLRRMTTGLWDLG
jgi:hypothetical protein